MWKRPGARRHVRRLTAPYPALLAAVLLALPIAGLAGCTGPTGSEPGTTTTGGGDSVLTIFAAASLHQAFAELAAEFEQRHPGTEIRLNFAGSTDLAAQISAGAPADVFASADPRPMDRLREEGLLTGTPEAFAANSLVIAVQPGNPHGIASLQDLAQPELNVVLCAPQVPCGSAAARAQAAAGVVLHPVSEERSVTDVLGRVTSGQADAGLVYATDIRAADGDAEGVEFREAAAAVNTYPAAVLAGSEEPALASAFVDVLTGPDGRAILRNAGFAEPPR